MGGRRKKSSEMSNNTEVEKMKNDELEPDETGVKQLLMRKTPALSLSSNTVSSKSLTSTSNDEEADAFEECISFYVTDTTLMNIPMDSLDTRSETEIKPNSHSNLEKTKANEKCAEKPKEDNEVSIQLDESISLKTLLRDFALVKDLVCELESKLVEEMRQNREAWRDARVEEMTKEITRVKQENYQLLKRPKNKKR